MFRALHAVPVALALVVAGPGRAADGHASAAQTINVIVTKDGFVPDRVAVKSGQPVKLVVTRKVERTCATEIVMKDFGVNQALPLEKAVTVTVTPKKPGEYRFSCAHGHIGGSLKVD